MVITRRGNAMSRLSFHGYNQFGRGSQPIVPKMTQLVLTDDQLRTVLNATDQVLLCDQYGNLVGLVTLPFNAAEIEEAQRRHESQGPWFSTDEVLQRLRSLEQEYTCGQ